MDKVGTRALKRARELRSVRAFVGQLAKIHGVDCPEIDDLDEAAARAGAASSTGTLKSADARAVLAGITLKIELKSVDEFSGYIRTTKNESERETTERELRAFLLSGIRSRGDLLATTLRCDIWLLVPPDILEIPHRDLLSKFNDVFDSISKMATQLVDDGVSSASLSVDVGIRVRVELKKHKSFDRKPLFFPRGILDQGRFDQRNTLVKVLSDANSKFKNETSSDVRTVILLEDARPCVSVDLNTVRCSYVEVVKKQRHIVSNTDLVFCIDPHEVGEESGALIHTYGLVCLHHGDSVGVESGRIWPLDPEQVANWSDLDWIRRVPIRRGHGLGV